MTQVSNPVGWFEVYVEDMKRAVEFYQSVLKVDLETLPLPAGADVEMEMMAFPMNPTGMGASGALVKMDGFSSGGSGTIIYFSCEDCAVEESRVESAGGKVHQSKMAIGEYGFVVMATDSEGNMIGLHSRK